MGLKISNRLILVIAGMADQELSQKLQVKQDDLMAINNSFSGVQRSSYFYYKTSCMQFKMNIDYVEYILVQLTK